MIYHFNPRLSTMTNLKQHIVLGLGVILMIGGLIAAYQPVMNWWHQRETQAKYGPATQYKISNAATKSNQLITGKPAKIEIPSVKIKNSIIDGYYNSGSKSWTLTLDKAQYATNTPMPNNQSGDTFIYGHNRREVFYELPKIEKGAVVIVTTTNNHKFTYKLASVKTTKPEDISLFDYKGPPMLTLQTCTGLWYQNRTLFNFQLVKVV